MLSEDMIQINEKAYSLQDVTTGTEEEALVPIEFKYSDDFIRIDSSLQGFPLVTSDGILFPVMPDYDFESGRNL